MRKPIHFQGGFPNYVNSHTIRKPVSVLDIIIYLKSVKLRAKIGITLWLFLAEISGCIALTSNITRKQTGPGRWQPANLVQAASQQFNSDEIGQEKELIWSGLNTECFKATLFRCEIPHVCERVFFDPKPRSQYMLTHQLLHRMVAEQVHRIKNRHHTTPNYYCVPPKLTYCHDFQPDCLQDITRHADPNVNLNLCAKMYKESEYVSGLQRRLGLSYLEDLQAEFGKAIFKIDA